MKKATLFCFIALINLYACNDDKEKVNLVFIGDSITQGVLLSNSETQAPPFIAVKYLQKNYDVNFANCGVSGYTTFDFLPEINKQFTKVIAAADTLYSDNETLVFSFCIGTNDSAIEGPNGSPISPEQYRENMGTIIKTLIQRYPKSYFILHQPIWYSPNTHNTARYLEEGLDRLQSYTTILNELEQIDPIHVLKGDRYAYVFFEKHWEERLIKEKGNSGDFYLHPNEAGAEKLGGFWGIAIESQLRKIAANN